MSGFMQDVARAALPVAIVLGLLAGITRVVIATRFGDEQTQRTAWTYLEPLSTWCLVAVGIDVVALGLGGDAELVSFVLPIGIGVGAALLRSEVVDESPAPAPTPTVDRAEQVAPVPAPTMAPPAVAASTTARDDALWSGEDSSHRVGLWSR